MLSFAGVGCLVATGLFFVPVTWHISPRVVYIACPAFTTLTVAPSFIGVAEVLGPFNALFYGVVGVIVGFAFESAKKREN